MIDGTAAKLLIFISIKSINLFLGANSSKYIAAATPNGKAIIKVIDSINAEPTKAPKIPACSDSLESPDVKSVVLNLFSIIFCSCSCLTKLTCKSDILLELSGKLTSIFPFNSISTSSSRGSHKSI